MSDETLEKVVVGGYDGTTASLDGGENKGTLLNPEQSNRFIDYAWDESVLLRQVRKVTMKSNELDIDKVAIGRRVVRQATEAVDDGVNAGATFSKVTVKTTKLRLDWEISTEALEDNLEGADLEDHLARLFAQAYANDVEDLAINGDTASTEPLLPAFDGWLKLAADGDANEVDATGATALGRDQFNEAIKAMPRHFLQRRDRLRFYAHSTAVQDYLFSLTQTDGTYIPLENVAERVFEGGAHPNGPAGYTPTTRPFGVPLQEVPLFPQGGGTDDSPVVLTDPQNLIFGVKREFTVHREFQPKKDTTEYTMYSRVGVQIQEDTAVVIVTGIIPA